MRTLGGHSLVGVLLAAALVLTGCDNMQHQENVRPFDPSSTTPDGSSARIAPAHTVSRDAARDGGSGGIPVTLTPSFVRRGGERYQIFCADCHGKGGGGDGIVVERGFPRPVSLDDARVRRLPDRALFEAIGRGYGAMYGFADRITPSDRWAITAYVRALERSHSASVADLPEAIRRRLESQ